MTTRTIECIDCGVPVPDGRLSCRACGALLASVAGALRASIRVIEAVESPEPEAVEEPRLAQEPEADAEPTPDAEPEPVAEHQAWPLEGPAPLAEPEPDAVVQAGSEPEPVAATEPEEGDESIAEPAPDVEWVADPEPMAEVEAVVAPDLAAEPEREGIAAAVKTPPVPVASDHAPWPPPEDDEPVLEPRPYARQRTSIPDGVATSPAAYRPPTFALAAATAAGPSWPAGAATMGGSGRSAAADAPAEAAATDAGTISLAGRYVELAGWFVIAGAAMAILGFVLPWSRVVIGAAHTGGYLDTWGLASPSHLIVLAGLLVVLGLGIIPSTVPAWIRSGVLGLAAGGILLGLAWPYVVGPLGADVGVTLALVGGVALGTGGILASWATRHAPEEPSV